MAKRKAKRSFQGLGDLIVAAEADVLRDLLRGLTISHPEIVPHCLDFLTARLELDASDKADAAALAVFALWEDVESNLAELNSYGGGPDEQVQSVAEGLQDLSERVPQLERTDRRDLLDRVLPYIQSGNTGMDDPLYDLAFAACCDDEDLRHLAREFESLGSEYDNIRACEIYRKLHDRDDYLRVRARRMKYGLDYYDLVTFHEENGDHAKAVEVAREGIAKATGRMDELRAFYAGELKRLGDREGYLDLEFTKLSEGPTPKTYEAFKSLCSPEEWTRFEPQFLAALARTRAETQLELRMARKEYDEAIALLAKLRYGWYAQWVPDSVVQAAHALEQRFPDQVLAFYQTGIGSLDDSAPRGEYARRAAVVAKLRHMWVDVLKTPEEWLRFARHVKTQNVRRPAMQEEFSKVIREWRDL